MHTISQQIRLFGVAIAALASFSAVALERGNGPLETASVDPRAAHAQIGRFVLAQNETAATDNPPKRGWLDRATFGLVGSRDAEGKSAARAEKEEAKAAKAEAKRAEKEAKRQRQLEKKQQKDMERAAREEEKSGGRGWLNRMTFGLAGNGRNEAATEADKAEKKEAKSANAEAKRAEKEAKRAEKAARKRESEISKAQTDSDETSRGEKRGFFNRMTFGLLGDDGATAEASQQSDSAAEEKRLAKEAEKQRKLEEKERKKAEKLARKEEKQAQKEEKKASHIETGQKRGLMSRLTFGLVGGGKEIDEAPSTSATEVETPEAKGTEPDAGDVEASALQVPGPQPAEGITQEESQKRPLMSRLTFGLVGGEKELETQPVAPEPTPEQLAMAAPADAPYDVQPASAMGPEERRLAALPFRTTVAYDSVSGTGKPQATASRETYSKSGYGITDLGDVRIAVRGMTFPDESRAAGIVISSDDRARAAGRGGIGNAAFAYEYERGVTTCAFGTVQFTISKAVITVAGKSVPIGRGRKLIVLDEQGGLLGAYEAQ